MLQFTYLEKIFYTILNASIPRNTMIYQNLTSVHIYKKRIQCALVN